MKKILVSLLLITVLVVPTTIINLKNTLCYY